MAEDTYGFEQARVRLEEIATQVKRKDTSLEQSLDLLEEGVRLANMCTEQIDHTQWRAAVEVPAEAAGTAEAGSDEAMLADDAQEAAGEPEAEADEGESEPVDEPAGED